MYICGATGMGNENCYLADRTICFGGPHVACGFCIIVLQSRSKSTELQCFCYKFLKKTAYKGNVKLGSFLDPLLCFDPNQLLHNISVIKT
jgi:hypothetical protein